MQKVTKTVNDESFKEKKHYFSEYGKSCTFDTADGDVSNTFAVKTNDNANSDDLTRRKAGSWLNLASILCLLLAVVSLLWVLFSNNKVTANANVGHNVAVSKTQPEEKYITKNIEDIHLGERTLGTNPQGIEESESDSEIFQKVKHKGYTLLYLKEDQTLSVIELLRPENWLESENIQIRRGSDDKILTESELEQFDFAKEFNRDDEDYDLEVWIELPEMGIVGWATLVAIDDEVKIQEGPGNVVTGTFAHISDNVIELQLEKQDKPIGCTGNHPFWSVDRQEFIEAGQLLNGERVLLYSGETKRVVQKLPRPGPQVVYNLEVYAEHVYHVTQDGVLVHNSCNPLRDNMLELGLIEKGEDAHHIVAQGAKLAKNTRKILERVGIDIHDVCNGVGLPKNIHNSLHTQAYYKNVYQRLRRAVRRNQSVENELSNIARELKNGLFKAYP